MTDEPEYFEGADMIARLKELLLLAKAGEIDCCAYRVFKTDGTYEDVAVGGTEEKRAELLAKIQNRH